MNDLFPVFLRLSGKRALVVGGGAMASTRAGQLLAAGAAVTLIAPRVNEQIETLARNGSIDWHRRVFVPDDVTRDFFIIVGATDHKETQAALARAAEEQGLLYNVVDDVEHCNFFSPAVVARGDLKIAISTNGRSPVLARNLREKLEAALPENAEDWLFELGEFRQRLKLEIPADFETRKRIIEEVIERTFDHAHNRQS